MAWVQGTGTRKAECEAIERTRDTLENRAKAGQLIAFAGGAPPSRAEMRARPEQRREVEPSRSEREKGRLLRSRNKSREKARICDGQGQQSLMAQRAKQCGSA